MGPAPPSAVNAHTAAAAVGTCTNVCSCRSSPRRAMPHTQRGLPQHPSALATWHSAAIPTGAHVRTHPPAAAAGACACACACRRLLPDHVPLHNFTALCLAGLGCACASSRGGPTSLPTPAHQLHPKAVTALVQHACGLHPPGSRRTGLLLPRCSPCQQCERCAYWPP